MTATTENLEMSLDQLIKQNKESRRRRGGRGWSNNNRQQYRGGYGGGPFRNRQMKWGMLRFRPTPKFITHHHQGVWQRDIEKVTEILPPFLRPPSLGIETGIKLHISNLDYQVSTDDIQELFSEVGDVKRCSINYDPSGRSKGTAEVVYYRTIDAIAALKRYNDVHLDGQAMKIEFIGNNVLNMNMNSMPSTTTTTTMAAQSASSLQVQEGHNLISLPSAWHQAPNRAFGMGRGRRWWGYRRRGGRGGRGGGFRGRSAAVATKSAAELDAELDTYHSQAMET